MNNISSDTCLMNRGIEATNDYLAHHGVLGMKWGIRKDGKPQGWQGGAGKAVKKVGSGAKKVAKGTASAAVKSRAKIQQVQEKRNEQRALEEARLNELKLEDRKRQMSSSYSIASTTRSARALSKHMDSLSDDELRQRINRLKLENEVRNLSAQERERSRSWISKTLEDSAKSSVKSLTTYGITTSGRRVIDGFLDEVWNDNSGKDKSKGNKQSIIETSTSSSGSSSYTTSDGNKSISYKMDSGGSKSSGYSISSGGSKSSGYTIAPGGSKRSSYTFSPGGSKSSGYTISPGGSKRSGYSISPGGSKSSGYSISPGILGSSDYKMSSTMDKGSDFIINYIEPSEKYK